jgi:hypothetical protein
VAELLTVTALSKAILSSVNLHLNGDVAEAWQTENFLGFCHLGQGDKEEK